MGNFINFKILPFILLILSNEFVNIKTSNQPTYRIAGGNPINIDEAKFVVQVISDTICGGSLITPLHVVTAAHCINKSNRNITVIGGATNINDGGQKTTVRQIYYMDYCSYKVLLLDVVVLRLESALIGPNIATIELCNSHWQPGDLMKIYGWGDTNETAIYDARRTLRMVEVPVQKQKLCQLIFHTKLPKTLFCAGVFDEKDSCSGDSGGPAVFNNQLCGIISFGYTCPMYSFYVNVYYVKDFVQRILKLDGF